MEVLRIKSMLIMWAEDFLLTIGTRQEQVKSFTESRLWLASSLSPEKVFSVQVSRPPF